MEEWAEIRRLHRAEGMSIKAIARRLGVARNTVREALRSDGAAALSARADGFAGRCGGAGDPGAVRRVPAMPATVIAERIGWDARDDDPEGTGARAAPAVPAAGSVPAHLRIGRASWPSGICGSPTSRSRSVTARQAKQWTVVGVAGFSRLIGGWMVPSRTAADVLGGMGQVLGQFGAVPRLWVWDQEACIGRWTHGRQRADRRVPGVPRRLRRRRQALCARLTRKQGSGRAGQRLPRDELSAGPPLRRCRRLQPATHQLAASAGEPTHPRHDEGRGRRRRSSRTAGRCSASRRCCPTRPAASVFASARDHYVRVDTCDYSINPRFIGRRIDVRVTLDEVIATCAGVEVARHARCLATHQTLTLPEHGRSPASCAPSRPSSTPSPRRSSSNATSPSTTVPSEAS